MLCGNARYESIILNKNATITRALVKIKVIFQSYFNKKIVATIYLHLIKADVLTENDVSDDLLSVQDKGADISGINFYRYFAQAIVN